MIFKGNFQFVIRLTLYTLSFQQNAVCCKQCVDVTDGVPHQTSQCKQINEKEVNKRKRQSLFGFICTTVLFKPLLSK